MYHHSSWKTTSDVEILVTIYAKTSWNWILLNMLKLKYVFRVLITQPLFIIMENISSNFGCETCHRNYDDNLSDWNNQCESHSKVYILIFRQREYIQWENRFLRWYKDKQTILSLGRRSGKVATFNLEWLHIR